MGRSKRGHERRLEECWSWRQLSAQRHLRHPNVHRPLRIPVTPNYQYLPKLLLSSSRDQVREDRVVRELQPCSELVTMPCKVESEVEFAPVLGVGRSPQVMYWESTRGRMPRGPPGAWRARWTVLSCTVPAGRNRLGVVRAGPLRKLTGIRREKEERKGQASGGALDEVSLFRSARTSRTH